MSVAAAMPTVGSVTSNWASLGQHGLFMSTLTTFGQISSIFSMPVAGYVSSGDMVAWNSTLSFQLCMTSFGWKSVFYLHALVSGVIFAFWYCVYRNQPCEYCGKLCNCIVMTIVHLDELPCEEWIYSAKHPWISHTELGTIHRGKSAADLQKYDSKGKRKEVQSHSIYRIPTVLFRYRISTLSRLPPCGQCGSGLLEISSLFRYTVGRLSTYLPYLLTVSLFQLIHIFSPLYLHEVLGYSVQKTGWTAALPVLFQFFVKVRYLSIDIPTVSLFRSSLVIHPIELWEYQRRRSFESTIHLLLAFLDSSWLHSLSYREVSKMHFS